MNRFSSVVLTAVALVLAIGCGGGSGNKLGIKEGDKLVVTERLERERFNASYGESVKSVTNTNGALTEVPEGTVFEVFTTPREGAATVEFVPVKSFTVDSTGAKREITDATELRNMFVQERYLTDNFLYYTFSLSADYIGTKLKKVEQ